MSEAKHTPGEWEAKRNADDPLNGWRVVGGPIDVFGVPMAVVVAHVNTHGEETEPNARLIAAAPDLMHALQLMLSAFGPTHPEMTPQRYAAEKALAAIRKGTGE